MNARHVQGIVTTADAQEACTLFKSFGTKACDLQQVLTIFECTIGLTPTHDGFGNTTGQTRNARQQRHAGCIQVNTDSIHTIFHHGFQGTRQFSLIDVVLVLTHTDGLWINFDQLGQGVLQAARNTGGTAQAYVNIWHFLAGKFTGGIDRSARFAHHHLLNFLAVGCFELFDEISGQFVGFAAGSAIANGDQIDTMFLTQFVQRMQRAIPIAARLVRVNRGSLYQFTGVINNRNLDACANAGVQAQHHTRTSRCRQQQISKVVCKNFDGHFFGFFTQACKEIAF